MGSPILLYAILYPNPSFIVYDTFGSCNIAIELGIFSFMGSDLGSKKAGNVSIFFLFFLIKNNNKNRAKNKNDIPNIMPKISPVLLTWTWSGICTCGDDVGIGSWACVVEKGVGNSVTFMIVICGGTFGFGFGFGFGSCTGVVTGFGFGSCTGVVTGLGFCVRVLLTGKEFSVKVGLGSTIFDIFCKIISFFFFWVI
jgi:hypothetical protein